MAEQARAVATRPLYQILAIQAKHQHAMSMTYARMAEENHCRDSGDWKAKSEAYRDKSWRSLDEARETKVRFA